MEAIAVVVAMAVAVVVAVVVTVAVGVATVIMEREILVHQSITRQCVLSMTRPTPHARTVDGTVANGPIH